MPQMPPLSDEGLKDLLSQPLVAKLATVSPSGEPNISALWLEARNGNFLVNAWGTTRAAKNLEHSPKCSLLIDTAEFHYTGTAVVEGPTSDQEGMGKLFARYKGGDVAEATEYAGQLTGWGDRIYIRFTPEKHVAWDFRQC